MREVRRMIGGFPIIIKQDSARKLEAEDEGNNIILTPVFWLKKP
jgi:hypothetical protein